MIWLDLGCGPSKRPGSIGIDIEPMPGVDHVVDFNTQPLPFEDGSVDGIFSSHCFEHVAHPRNILNEMLRVCKNEARVELWMPYGHSNDAFVCGHDIFYTELQWQHFVLDYPEHWTPNAPAWYRWERIRYNLRPGVAEKMAKRGIGLDFAIEHMVNVAWEFGLFFTVLHGQSGTRKQPRIEFAYGREGAAFKP